MVDNPSETNIPPNDVPEFKGDAKLVKYKLVGQPELSEEERTELYTVENIETKTRYSHFRTFKNDPKTSENH